MLGHEPPEPPRRFEPKPKVEPQWLPGEERFPESLRIEARPPVEPPEFDMFGNRIGEISPLSFPEQPYDRLTGFQKVLFNEGDIIDYQAFDTTGEFVIVDEYAADLINKGWFDPWVSPEDRMEARAEYFDYTGTSPRDFDWGTWKDWYASSAAA